MKTERPFTISRRKSNLHPLFQGILNCFNGQRYENPYRPAPFEVIINRQYEPIEINEDDYVKFGESPDREYFRLKTQMK